MADATTHAATTPRASSEPDNGVVTAVLTGIVVGMLEPELLPGMAIGVAATLGPRLLPALGSTIRPLMQTVVRAGYAATRSAREMIAEAGEQFDDMVAEARATQEETASPIVTPAGSTSTGRKRPAAEPGGNQ